MQCINHALCAEHICPMLPTANAMKILLKFPRFLIDYSYFHTRIVISCDQRSVKRLNFQYNIKITTHF